MNILVENYKLRARIAEQERKIQQQARLIEKQRAVIEFCQKEVESYKGSKDYYEQDKELHQKQEAVKNIRAQLLADYDTVLKEWESEKKASEKKEDINEQDGTQGV